MVTFKARFLEKHRATAASPAQAAPRKSNNSSKPSACDLCSKNSLHNLGLQAKTWVILLRIFWSAWLFCLEKQEKTLNHSFKNKWTHGRTGLPALNPPTKIQHHPIINRWKPKKILPPVVSGVASSASAPSDASPGDQQVVFLCFQLWTFWTIWSKPYGSSCQGFNPMVSVVKAWIQLFDSTWYRRKFPKTSGNRSQKMPWDQFNKSQLKTKWQNNYVSVQPNQLQLIYICHIFIISTSPEVSSQKSQQTSEGLRLQRPRERGTNVNLAEMLTNHQHI